MHLYFKLDKLHVSRCQWNWEIVEVEFKLEQRRNSAYHHTLNPLRSYRLSRNGMKFRKFNGTLRTANGVIGLCQNYNFVRFGGPQTSLMICEYMNNQCTGSIFLLTWFGIHTLSLAIGHWSLDPKRFISEGQVVEGRRRREVRGEEGGRMIKSRRCWGTAIISVKHASNIGMTARSIRDCNPACLEQQDEQVPQKGGEWDYLITYSLFNLTAKRANVNMTNCQ